MTTKVMRILIALLLLPAYRTLPAQISIDTSYYDEYNLPADLHNASTIAYHLYEDRSLSQSGVVKKFTVSGILMSEVSYSDIGEKIQHGPAVYFHENGSVKTSMMFENGKLRGELTTYYPDGQLKRKEIYVKGEMTEGYCYTEDGSDTTHYAYTIPPQFPGGDDVMMRKTYSNIRYPARARESGIQGTVVAQFVIDKNGVIRHPRIVKSVHRLLDDEVLRVVSMMPDWLPGLQDGEPVHVIYTLPLSFKLQ